MINRNKLQIIIVGTNAVISRNFFVMKYFHCSQAYNIVVPVTLESTKTKDGTSLKQIKTGLMAQAHPAMTRPEVPVSWKNNDRGFPTKIELTNHPSCQYCSYGCESWTLTADLESRIQACENKCYRRMLGIS